MATYEDVVNLALRRSLFFPTSEIYPNYPAGFFDFGPFGATIKRKIIDVWRKILVQSEDFLEIDGALAMPADVFKASGHLESFNDPITVCKKCGAVYRADNLLTDLTGKEYKEAMDVKVLTEVLRKNKIICQNKKCKGELSDVTESSLMVKLIAGVGKTDLYIRPETCQNIFLDFSRLCKTMRIKLPKGVAQVGLAYRNEISPRQTLLRSVQFTQMESEVFFNPKEINQIENWNSVKDYEVMVQRAHEKKAQPISCKDLVKNKITSGKLIAYYLARTQQLYEALGLKKENMRFRELDDEERAFYAKEAFDFEVKTSVGWLELIANNYRTDHDLKGHMNDSKQDMHFLDEKTGKKFVPHVWEISIGTNRTFYAVLENALKKKDDKWILSLPVNVAPFHAGIFPLLSNKSELVEKAKGIYDQLKCCYEVMFDKTGSIGKRYARVDEIGVPLCITVDFDSLKNDDVTIRDRDTSDQKRVKISDLQEVLYKLLTGVSFKEL